MPVLRRSHPFQINKKAKGRKNNEVKRWRCREICVTLHPIMIPWRLKEEAARCLSALRKNPFILINSMYAIVDINGQQFKAEEGKKLFVHHIKDAEEGKTVEFDKCAARRQGRRSDCRCPHR
jgi:hypothetical protein